MRFDDHLAVVSRHYFQRRLKRHPVAVDESNGPKELFMPNFLQTFCARAYAWVSTDDGQGLTEYALVLALIAVVAVVALHFLGGKVDDALSTVGSSVNG
jgi:pilus assembly protein Flp/PilA